MNEQFSTFSKTNRRWLEGWWLIRAILAVWSVILGVWIYRESIIDGGMPCWDGYDRCSWGASIWVTLQNGDWGLFWEYTNQQFVWPFLHSWVTGLLFWLFGPSVTTARLFALASYVAMAVLLLYWFRGIGHRREWFPLSGVGALTAWLLFTTPAVFIEHASSVMSELPGLLLVTAVLFVCPREDRGRVRWNLLAGILLGLLFWYKYNFAGLTYIGLLIARGLQAWQEGRTKEPFRLCWHNGLLFGVPLLMMGLWMLPNFASKLDGLIYFAVNNPEARMPFSWQSLLYYPVVIPERYFAHPWIAYASLILVLASAPFNRKLRFTNPLVTCFLIHFAAAVAHPMKDPRFILIPMGLYYLITAESLVAMLHAVRAGSYTVRFIPVTALATVMLVLTVAFQSEQHRQPHVTQARHHLAPIHTAIDRLQPGDRPTFLLAHDQVIPPAVNYYLTYELRALRNPMNGERFRWNHGFMFTKGETVRNMPEEERFEQLRHHLWLEQSQVIVTMQSTQPWKIANFDNLYGGVHEYANLPPYMGEFERTFERYYPKIEGLLRIYRYRGTPES